MSFLNKMRTRAMVMLVGVMILPASSFAAWQFSGASGGSGSGSIYCDSASIWLGDKITSAGNQPPGTTAAYASSCKVNEGGTTLHDVLSSVTCSGGTGGTYYSCQVQFTVPSYAGGTVYYNANYQWDVINEIPQEVGEPTCGGMQGKQFTVANSGNALQSGSSGAGYDYGCEFKIASCDGSSCTGCYTGNGTYHDDSATFRQWTHYPLSIGNQTVAEACPANPSPTGHPGYCEPSNPLYDANTATCLESHSGPVKNCNDPTWVEGQACTWVFEDGDNATDIPLPYQPPSPTPAPPQDDFEDLLDGTPPVTPTQPVINPGDVPSPGDIGGIDNPGYDGTGGTGSTVDTGSVSWGAFPAIPTDGFYTRQYENGVSGVMAENLSAMQETPLFSYISSFNLNDGISYQPTFSVDLTTVGLGVHEFDFFEANLFWQIAKVVCIISALLLCRRLVFGG